MSAIRFTRFRLAIFGAIAAVTLGCGRPLPSSIEADEESRERGNNARSTELDRVLDRVMARPEIHTEPGFSARVLIAPGESQLYDPVLMRDRGNAVWISDDGGLEEEKGGQILAIDTQGKISEVVPLGRLTWVHGFDIAPASFAPYGGQIFLQSAVEAGKSGVLKGNIVQRLDATAQEQPETFCTLPPSGGADGQGIPGGGGDARFGPDDSRFAEKFFVVTTINGAVYQMTADGRCTPFVTFDPQKWGFPWGLAFSPDGQHMLVSMLPLSMFGGEGAPGKATIARVRSDGTVETEPLVRAGPDKLLGLFGMAYAPAGYGDYAGQLFVAANGSKWALQFQGKSLTDTLPEAGEVYRLTPEGELKRVASGFRGAVGVHFIGNRLWVSDINGDFLWQVRELPDGFIVEITPTP